MNDYASSEARLHFHRRDLLVAMAALPFVAAACQSGARTETVAKIQEATKGDLAELATSPEEAERLLAVYDRMGASATRLVATNVEFVEAADSMLKDRTVPAGDVTALLDANVKERTVLMNELLKGQAGLQSALGSDRWAKFVDSVNDPERMKLLYARED